MRRLIYVVGLLLAVALPLSACGSKAANSNNGTTTGATATDASGCPTTEQKMLDKTRFAANVGLIAGTTYHWIYQPYQAGTFASGAQGRTAAIVKAGIAALAVAKLTDNAINDVKDDPLLCKVMIQPLNDLKTQLGAIKTKVEGGDLSAVTDLNGTVGKLTDAAKGQGMSIVQSVAGGI